MSAIHLQKFSRQNQKNVLRKINTKGYNIGEMKLGIWQVYAVLSIKRRRALTG